MVCKSCKKKIDEGYTFCPFCGESIDKVEIVDDPYEKPVKKQAKCWKIFARVSKILGIVTISTCWIPMLGFISGSIGITFGILGKHSDTKQAQDQRRVGIILSAIGGGISFIIYFVIIFGLIGLLTQLDYSMGGM